MKKEFGYYQFKWTALFIIGLILTFSVLGYLHSTKSVKPKETPAPQPPSLFINDEGFISNHSFSLLIEKNMKELNLLKNISFQGKENGLFSISANVSDFTVISSLIKELEPYKPFLNALKGKEIALSGHLTENDQGNGNFMFDTITYSGQQFSAALITPYIEKYTSLNALVAVPFDGITINENGVTFASDIPSFIQTVFDNPDQVHDPLRE